MYDEQRPSFLREYIGIPWHDPKEDALRAAAKAYHEETEAYDRMVCTGPIHDGMIMPMGPVEMGMIGRNARDTRERIFRERLVGLGVTQKEWQQAIVAAAKEKRHAASH